MIVQLVGYEGDLRKVQVNIACIVYRITIDTTKFCKHVCHMIDTMPAF